MVKVKSKFLTSIMPCLRPQISESSATPLHAAYTWDEITALLDQYDINVQDSNGDTALHMRVQENYMSSVISLLSLEAEVNVSNNIGDSPLHEATTPAVLQALLVFGANIEALNNKEASGDRPILDLFDWIAGTSTGGILALALASGKSVPDARRLYFRFKNTIFYGSRPYAEEPLEELLKKEFGEDKFMSDIKGVKLIVTGVLVDRSQAELHLFRNYDSPQYLMKGNCHPGNPAASCEFYTPAPPQEQLVWKTARATGAAPSYFPSSGAYLDGGIIANNPTLDVLTEITEYNTILKSLNRASEIIKPQVVFSLGTGCYSLEKNDVIDSVSPTIMTWDFGNYSKLQELFDLLLNQATRTVDRARSWCSMCDISYIRLNPELNENIELNETDDAKLVNMLWETMIYIKGKREQIQTFANLLTTGLPNNDL